MVTPAPSEVTLPWFALKVRARSEPVAISALRNRGYDPFCPTYSERRRYKDRMKVIENAAFPGYLFCRFHLEQKVSVISSHSVQYLVGVGGVPSEIPEKDICNIRRAVEAGARPTPYFKAGQCVRVEFGSLAGVEGILLRCSGGDRLVISIELLQRSVSLEVSKDHVRAL
jgi:transcription antitermination factor NusG